MKFENQSFSKLDIHMDFNEFVNCRFNDCTLVYHGYGLIGMSGCSFSNVHWSFADAAANTISFMTGLYSGAGEGGRNLIEQTFENIRKGQIIPLRK